MGHLQVAGKNTESRLERLVQAGRETQRHLVSAIHIFNLEAGEGRLRYLVRLVCDRHAEWKSAQDRMPKGHSWGTPSHSSSL